jgi:hypothetical protein
MTLTVRLDAALESALERYCHDRGMTKSLVVQQALAEYLVAAPARSGTPGARRAGPPSANYLAFAKAGLIGAGTLGGRSADKAAVRERITQRLQRSGKAPVG